MKKKFTFVAALFFALVLTIPTQASLIRAADTDLTGTGLGNVFTVLTIDAPPGSSVETGCSFWTGTANATGSSGCPVIGFGGDELAVNSTWTIQEVGFTYFNYLRIGYNAIEAGGQLDTQIDALVLLIQNSSGTLLLYAPILASPEYFPDTVPGTGSGVFSFKLDAVQAAAANSFLAPTNRLGLAAAVSQVSAGHESFFFQTVPIPEPLTYWLIGAGLIALGLARSRRRKTSA